jgi:DNA replication and repair protein RecF
LFVRCACGTFAITPLRKSRFHLDSSRSPAITDKAKPTLLEALCVLATTKSPLVDRDRELIKWNEREARLGAKSSFPAGAATNALSELGWSVEDPNNPRATVSRDLRVGGVPQSRWVRGSDNCKFVAFFPHDLAIIAGEPDQRRRFLNLELGKSRPAHFADAARYRRALQQRNALLKHLCESRSRGRSPMGAAAEGLGTLRRMEQASYSLTARAF